MTLKLMGLQISSNSCFFVEESVGHSFAYVAHERLFKDVSIRTHKACREKQACYGYKLK